MRYSVKLLCAVLAGAIFVPCAAHAADADYDGSSAPSQITAYIDDRPIPSYNIDGVTFVPLSILPDYGFTVMEEADGYRITDAQNAYAGGALPRDTEKVAHS